MKNTTHKIVTRKITVCTNCLLLLLTVTFLTTVSLSSCSLPRTTLESKAFSGTIIDEETGKPIANAVVMIKWPIVGGYEGNTRGSIEVAESVTDAKGRYAIAGWVKKGRKEIAGAFLSKSNMVIYAAGYWPEIKHTASYDPLPRGEAWEADWDGEAIELKPAHREKWSYEQKKEYLSAIESYLGFYHIPKCAWLKIPNYYLAMHRALSKERNGGYTVLTGFLTSFRRDLKESCGIDPKDFFLSKGMTKKELDNCCSGKARPSQLEPVGTFLLAPEEEKPSGVRK